MFGNFGRPEPLPEHKAQTQFWDKLNEFLTFTAIVTAIGAVTVYAERRVHDSLHM
jgi:hypothetical protein